MSVEVVIAVHPPFAWLVDWRSLTAFGQRWFLITNEESKARLARDGVLPCFSSVVVAPSFELDVLSEIIRPWLTTQPSNVRIATMIEPMQMLVAALRERLQIPGPGIKALLPFTK